MTAESIRTNLLATDAQPEKFTTKQLYGCISREIAMRLGVYPNRVLAGKMTFQDAKEEMEMMKTVRRLIELSEKDTQKGQNQFDLFKPTE